MRQLLLVQGTALHLPLKDASVHCCVTSPPYWGLRKYDCGPGELGMEPSPDAYVDAMVQVFREVHRVLHPTGTLWLNCGDVYTSGNRDSYGPLTGKNVAVKIAPRPAQPSGLAAKNLLGLPWRLALALQADGWILRSDIIWDKPSCLPESVQDRPTRSHEYVFLFAKQAHYHYDVHAIREPFVDERLGASGVTRAAVQAYAKGSGRNGDQGLGAAPPYAGRNARTVWRISSEPTSYAHFATFPTALVRRCLLAGAPTQVCIACGAPWMREVERFFRPMTDRSPEKLARASGRKGIDASRNDDMQLRGYCDITTTGFAPTCTCAAGVSPSVVLDCFTGSGTTLIVARELGHHAIGIDLSYPYLSTIARERLGFADLARWEGRNGHHTPAVSYDALPLFAGST